MIKTVVEYALFVGVTIWDGEGDTAGISFNQRSIKAEASSWGTFIKEEREEGQDLNQRAN
jgi:hypothetical protein